MENNNISTDAKEHEKRESFYLETSIDEVLKSSENTIVADHQKSVDTKIKNNISSSSESTDAVKLAPETNQQIEEEGSNNRKFVDTDMPASFSKSMSPDPEIKDSSASISTDDTNKHVSSIDSPIPAELPKTKKSLASSFSVKDSRKRKGRPGFLPGRGYAEEETPKSSPVREVSETPTTKLQNNETGKASKVCKSSVEAVTSKDVVQTKEKKKNKFFRPLKMKILKKKEKTSKSTECISRSVSKPLDLKESGERHLDNSKEELDTPANEVDSGVGDEGGGCNGDEDYDEVFNGESEVDNEDDDELSCDGDGEMYRLMVKTSYDLAIGQRPITIKRNKVLDRRSYHGFTAAESSYPPEAMTISEFTIMEHGQQMSESTDSANVDMSSEYLDNLSKNRVEILKSKFENAAKDESGGQPKRVQLYRDKEKSESPTHTLKIANPKEVQVTNASRENSNLDSNESSEKYSNSVTEASPSAQSDKSADTTCNLSFENVVNSTPDFNLQKSLENTLVITEEDSAACTPISERSPGSKDLNSQLADHVGSKTGKSEAETDFQPADSKSESHGISKTDFGNESARIQDSVIDDQTLKSLSRESQSRTCPSDAPKESKGSGTEDDKNQIVSLDVPSLEIAPANPNDACVTQGYENKAVNAFSKAVARQNNHFKSGKFLQFSNYKTALSPVLTFNISNSVFAILAM